MVGANRFDNGIVGAGAGLLSCTGTAQEAVSRTFDFRVVAAGGADDGCAVRFEAIPVHKASAYDIQLGI